MNSIELIDVSYTYPNGFIALENINLKVEQGEKVAIIGQNGAGKTTTAKLMNGLLRPTTGKVLVNRKDICDMTCATVSRQVGYVFQNPGDQIFNSTVYREIEYALTHSERNFSASEINRRVKEAAEICHVTEFLDTNPYDLPFSLRKFVTIAICVANDCEVFILDEPTAGQDMQGLQWLQEIIDDLHAQHKTVITITHDMDFVIECFNQVIVMAHKNVIASDEVKDIFWNIPILDEAALRQPTIATLASKLKLEDKVVTVSEFAHSFVNQL